MPALIEYSGQSDLYWDHLQCNCNSPDHTLSVVSWPNHLADFEYAANHGEEVPAGYFFLLVQYPSFWKRIWVALKYLLGKQDQNFYPFYSGWDLNLVDANSFRVQLEEILFEYKTSADQTIDFSSYFKEKFSVDN